MKSQAKNNIADPIIYRLYWSIVCRDILNHLGYDSTRKNKNILHEFHKRVLGYETTAGQSQEIMSTFVAEVLLYWAEKGWFIRNNRKQDLGIENEELSKIWDKL
jgi:hypothetical protein